MKAIMYHYVREAPSDLDYFRYLHVDHFCSQLEYFGERYGFISRDRFYECLATGRPVPGVVLTFDDGLIDHYEYVLPILSDRKLWGIFYVPTSIYTKRKLLDVHRIQLLLGRFGGVRCLKFLKDISDPSMFPAITNEFRTMTYRHQSNDEATILFKRMMNFYVSYVSRSTLLDQLMASYLASQLEEDLTSSFYMQPSHLRELTTAGCVIGSHTVNHPVMSKLLVNEQEAEIGDSLDLLSSIIEAPVKTFCYPHGGFHTFTTETERLLSRAGVAYSFNVEPRDIESNDLRHRPQALPRYDCNQHPFGRASRGLRLAVV